MRDNVEFITYGADYITVNRQKDDGGYKVSKVPVLNLNNDPEGGKDAYIAAEKIFRLRF